MLEFSTEITYKLEPKYAAKEKYDNGNDVQPIDDAKDYFEDMLEDFLD